MFRPFRLTCGVLAAVAFADVGGGGAQAPAPPLRLVAELLVSDDELSSISEVRPGPAGYFLVGQPQDRAIVVLSPAGTLVRRIGRRGSGPGDIRRLDAFGVVGDTIWVADNDLRRMTSFDLSGRVLRVVSEDTAATSRARALVARDSALSAAYPRMSLPLAFGRGGRGIAALSIGTPDPVWSTAGGFPLFSVDQAGLPQRVIAWLPHRNSSWSVVQREGRATLSVSASQPFADDPVFSVSPDGNRLAVASVTVSAAARGMIDVIQFSPAGDTIARTGIPFTPVRLPGAVADSAINAQAGDGPLRATWLASAYVPAFYPAVTTIRVGDDGSVWLRGFPDRAACTWRVFDSHGVALGSLDLPATTQLTPLDARRVLAIEFDADSVATIVRYAVVRER